MCISDNRARYQVKSSVKQMLMSKQSIGALCTPAPGAGTACGVHSCVADDLPSAAVGWLDPNSPVAGRPSSGRDVPPSCPSHPQNRAGILPAGHLLPNWGRVNLDRTALKATVRNGQHMMPLKMILVSPRTKKTALKSTISVSSEFEYLNLPSVMGKSSKGQPTPPARRLVTKVFFHSR